MTNVTTVNLTNGVPSGPAGASTVSTIDNLIAVGSPIKDGISANVATVAQLHATDNQSLPGSDYELAVASIELQVNGSGNFDRRRGNVDTAALLTLTAQAAGTVNSADQTNYNGRGLVLVFDMTVATTTSIVIKIQGKDAASSKYYDILSSSAITTVSTTQLTVYPGAPVTANVSASQPLPRTWRVQAIVTGGSSAATATAGASVIL